MNLMTFVKLQWDRVGAWVCIGAGALALLFGYIGISGTPHVASQLPFIISGGLFGIFLLGLGGLLWISADLRDEWRELWVIREALLRTLDDQAAAPLHAVPSFASRDDSDAIDPGTTAPRSRRRRATAGDRG